MTPDEAKRTQQRLGVVPDGDFGRASYAALFAKMGARDNAGAFGAAAAKHFPTAGITTPLRIAHFMAQAAHETGNFRYAREIWGPTPAQKGYEGRADLGNCIAGDGQKFLGRGVLQITGRDNYQRLGRRIGIDLVCNPARVEEPLIAVQLACIYWSDHDLNPFADADDLLAISNGINRGNPRSTRTPNGLDDRRKMLVRAKAVLL